MSLPIAFDEKIKALLKDEYSDYIKCFDEQRLYGLRVNTSKITVKEFEQICPFEIRPIPWIENGFYYDGDVVQPSKHPYYFAGLYYLQEPSAMTPANRLPIDPGDKVLDICAAPGGKATELGAKLLHQGILAANDISSSRAKGLLKNMEVFGIPNVLVLSEDPENIENYFTGYFDKILIDAPCSGEGMFRKDKKMMRAWEEYGPEFFVEIQRKIITQAAHMLKQGGLMLYSTCTFDPEENEGTIEHLLNVYPEFEICEMKQYEGFEKGCPKWIGSKRKDLHKTVRIWPHKMHGEGHYLALLKKGRDAAAKTVFTEETIKEAACASWKLPQELEEFLARTTFPIDKSCLELHKEHIYYMPKGLPSLKKVRFLRTGLYLGDVKKNRFEPSQAFAMCLKKEEYANVLDFPVEDERVWKYLRGETLDVEDICQGYKNGWYLILTDGYPLGWGKVLNGTLKNKYFPGWRSMS